MRTEKLKIIENKINRSNWIKFKFSDLVENITEKVSPKNSNLEHYIGLKHLDSGSLEINRFGETSDLKGEKQKIYEGDFILAKRNAYLKRVAIAKFDALASAHSFVLRAKAENILPSFLPFFLLSEKFWSKAIEISVGSLSPTINWKALAKQEFLLPKKNDQLELSQLLWSIEEMIKNNNKVFDNLNLSYQAKIEESVPRNCKQTWMLGDICNFRRGATYKSSDYSNESIGIPALNLNSVAVGGGFNKQGTKFFSGIYKQEHFVTNEDLIIACTDITRHGRVVGYPLHFSAYQNKKMLFTMDLAAISINNKDILRDYFYYVLKAGWVHWKFFANSPGTTVLHLDIQAIKKIKIPKIDKNIQKEIIKNLKMLETSILEMKEQIDKACNLKKSLINQVFNDI